MLKLTFTLAYSESYLCFWKRPKANLQVLKQAVIKTSCNFELSLSESSSFRNI